MKKLAVLFSLVILFAVTTGCSMNTEEEPSSREVADDVNYDIEDYNKIIPANNELGFNLLPEVEADHNGNTFISPASLFMTLSMIYNGADGVTKEEIAKALNAEGISVKALNKANVSLLAALKKETDDTQLHIANAIWLNKDFHFQEDFAQHNNDYFHAKTKEIDISDDQSPVKMNDWVSEKTNGKIKEIVDTPLNSDLVAMLINAIYFKGDWKSEFDKKETEDQPFHLEEGTTKDVALMKLTEDLAYLENEEFQAVSLPYGEGEVSMKVFLPKENSSLKDFKKTLTKQNWEVWNSEFRIQKGTVLLPKFQIEYEATLNETLQHLGMKSAFDKDADFGQMIQEDDPVWISQVKQKTFIDVNEEGTEASAATSVEMETTSASIDEPFHMEVNRPFFIAIVDEETEAILSMGSINNP